MVRPLALLLCLLMSGCSPRETPTLSGQQLHLYTFSEYMPQALITGFEQATGAKVIHDTYPSNEAMRVGFKARPGYYDVLLPSDYMVETLIAEKLLKPLDLGKIPGWSNVERQFLSPYFDPGGATRGRAPRTDANAKYSLPFQWGTTGIAYNTRRVSPPPQRWADLWRPDIGALVILDDEREMLGLASLSLGNDKNETDPAKIEAARAHLATLMKGVQVIDSARPEAALLSGQANAGVMYSGNAALAARQNPEIAYVFPTEGAGIWFDNLVIPADAPNPEAAHAFINWVLKPENNMLITKEFPYSNPNREALRWLESHDPASFAAYQDSPTTNPPPEVLAGARLMKRLTPEATALYQRAWTELKALRKETPP